MSEPTETEEPTATKSDDSSAAKPPSPESTASTDGELLVVPGNPLRKRALIAILAGGVPAFLLMAKNGQNAWGIPLGFLFVCICAFGVMDLLGTFDDADEHVATSTSFKELAPSVGVVIALTLVFGGCLSLAQSAILSPFLAAGVVPGAFIALVAAVFALGKRLGPWRHDELGQDRPLTSRHGFWVIVIGALLYMPAMGAFGFWDPWETHYGEVAREILGRDDWISLWWAKDGWFWSKPVLNFWIQSLSMGTLGTHFHPDQFLIAADGTANARPEWVIRAPNVLMTIGAMYILYKGVAKVFGRRAGLLGAIVLATMPDWFFLAHQTMTDMPFVSAMTATMGLILLGLNTDEEARVRVYEVDFGSRKLRLSLWHLVFGLALLCAIPQILYLLSRNLEFVAFGSGPKGFRFHLDEFMSGSAGNCGLPGNEKCKPHSPAGAVSLDALVAAKAASSSGFWRAVAPALRFVGPILRFEPGVQAILWGVVIGGVLYLNWGERRTSRLLYIGAWLCAAIATLAKGPAGVGLPVLCTFTYVATKKRWSAITRFEPISGLLIILGVAIPWYVAMYVRHGSLFTDRLIYQDMVNRTFNHVHDTNEGADVGIRYYIQELGYATFPWIGLVPLGLLWGFRRSDSWFSRALGRPSATAGPGTRGSAVGDASVMLVMWFLFSYALFTAMGTKFHHYIFPAVPPAAMLVGIVLDDMLGRVTFQAPKTRALYLGGFALSAIVATLGASKLWPGSIFGGKPAADATGNTTLGVALMAIGVALFVVVVTSFAFPAEEENDSSLSPAERERDMRRQQHEQLMLGGAALAGALGTVLVGRDLAAKAQLGEASGGIRLLQLFTYNYKRPWPDTLDFGAILAGFTVVAGLLGVALAVRSIRRHVVAASCAFGILWAVWGLDVYMIAVTPHWGQRELIQAYYRNRTGPEEQLVAYHMNWKGENIYTGNRVPAWISSGADFQKWMKEEREKGTKVMYFVTEHSSMKGMQAEVGAKTFKPITDTALNNKFGLVRVEL